jgi:hypothetical protein
VPQLTFSSSQPGSQPTIHKITTFCMKQLGVLLETLRTTSEGAGNLLDSCAILATSECSDPRAHATTEYPLVVAGRAGGALRHPGIHHRAVGENTTKVLLTLLRAAGLPLTEYGGGAARVTSSCTPIEA